MSVYTVTFLTIFCGFVLISSFSFSRGGVGRSRVVAAVRSSGSVVRSGGGNGSCGSVGSVVSE